MRTTASAMSAFDMCRAGQDVLTATNWMLYGAYGTTGRLIVDEALRRGHRPVLAGRNAVRAVESLLETPCTGALTPVQAFGADFALGVRGRRVQDLQ